MSTNGKTNRQLVDLNQEPPKFLDGKIPFHLKILLLEYYEI